MQKIITETLDLGIPGEFASTNPRHIDLPYVVDTAVKFGTVVAVKDGGCAPVGTSNYTTKKGIVVSPHQHVSYGSGGDALAPTLDAAVGDTVAICDMGDVYVSLNLAVTASAITGKTTAAYIQHIKLSQAKNLLLTRPDLSISDIALLCGFDDNARFSKAFKQYYQQTPSQFKKQ